MLYQTSYYLPKFGWQRQKPMEYAEAVKWADLFEELLAPTTPGFAVRVLPVDSESPRVHCC